MRIIKTASVMVKFSNNYFKNMTAFPPWGGAVFLEQFKNYLIIKSIYKNLSRDSGLRLMSSQKIGFFRFRLYGPAYNIHFIETIPESSFIVVDEDKPIIFLFGLIVKK